MGGTDTDAVVITVSAPVDVTRPSVTLSTTAVNVQPGKRLVITAAFSEAVSGLVPADFVIQNGTITQLQGGSQTYTLAVLASGARFSIQLPADTVRDVAGNGNKASNLLKVDSQAGVIAQRLINDFMQQRMQALLSHQPALTHLLRDRHHRSGRLNDHADDKQGNIHFASTAQNVWSKLDVSWRTDHHQRYIFGAFGAHATTSDHLLLGGMVEVDHLLQTDGQATIKGNGYLLGPYAVAKVPNHNLYLEGRLLYGQSQNSVSPFGTYWDDFETTHWLT